MPTTKSAQKRLRQSREKRAKNRSVKRSIRTQYRKIIEAVQKGNAQDAEEEFREAAKQLDRAATRHVIHSNAARRTKSRLSAKIKAIKKK
ncbi:MAG: 30S ribosomal protein S20 [Thermoguttaceae bacterium]|jgi:small subunit ribosomal protein S20